ncbi:MAG: hypothetical protein HRT53_01845 [Colwellia sp.]|nr:hypothetical protein [Colwellia sp.]
MDTKLTFINQSQDSSKSEVLIFQKNTLSSLDEIPIAWKTIKYCGVNCSHPFTYANSIEISVSDIYGNYSPALMAQPGEQLSMANSGVVKELKSSGAKPGSVEVQVCNDLLAGSINVNVFRSGQLICRKTTLVPGEKAVFMFKPSIWLGVVSDVIEGSAINSAVMSHINTEISLQGIAAANLVMRGGGPGKNSTPFTFHLENVVAE